MVSKYVSKHTILESPQVRVDLISFKSFLEVNWNLRADLRQCLGLHFVISGFAEVQVLRLCKTKVAAHKQGLLWKIRCSLTSGHLCDKREQVFVNPSWLLEVNSSISNAVFIEVHVASLSHIGSSVVEETWVHLQQGQLGLFLDFSVRTIPRKCYIHVSLQDWRRSLPWVCRTWGI